jgi:hypothetical protein
MLDYKEVGVALEVPKIGGIANQLTPHTLRRNRKAAEKR